MRLEMPHSCSQEQVWGWENWPTSLLTPLQSKKVERPLLKPYQITELRQGGQDIPVWICQPNNTSGLIPQEAPLWRMCLGMVVLIINHHIIGPQEAENVTDVGETRGLCNLSSFSPSPDCGFKSNQSSLLMASSMSSRSDRSDGSQCLIRGRWHWEDGAHMKINIPIFKDEDTKDAVTYKSGRWDLMVYWCAGCRDHTFLLYAIRSLQGYPGELVQSSGMDITLEDVLTISDEHYNNMTVLDVLYQELFQL